MVAPVIPKQQPFAAPVSEIKPAESTTASWMNKMTNVIDQKAAAPPQNGGSSFGAKFGSSNGNSGFGASTFGSNGGPKSKKIKITFWPSAATEVSLTDSV